MWALPKTSAKKKVAARPSLSRRIPVRSRIALAIAIPSFAFLAVIGTLLANDVRSLQELREFSDVASEITAQVQARAALQLERHRTTSPQPDPDLDADRLLIDSHLAELGIIDGTQFAQDLDLARTLAAEGQHAQATLHYTDLIRSLEATIDSSLRSAPLGIADQRGTGLRALLAAEEALLREDLETRRPAVDPLTLNDFHNNAIAAFGVFEENGSPSGAQQLSNAISSDPWRELNLIRLNSLTATTAVGDRSADVEATVEFDHDAWDASASIRQDSLAKIVANETQLLGSEVASTANDEFRTLGLLAVAAAGILGFAGLLTLRLRRSIVNPLTLLTRHAHSLADGHEVTASDNSIDEIGEMSRAFVSISTTVGNLWVDVDAVSAAMTEGRFDTRVRTAGLEGDWLRLATTMNEMLATGEEHRIIVKDELDRRGALAQISNAAAVATTPAELTASILHHLPSALADSQAHLHLHPLGEPLVDLGMSLEPSISALELPSPAERAGLVQLRDGLDSAGQGIAALVEFPEGPPAVLILSFGPTPPVQVEAYVTLVATAAQVLAQAHRRQAAEIQATHDREHDQLTELPNEAFLRTWYATNADRATLWSMIGVHVQRLDELDGLLGRSSSDDLLKTIGDALSTVVAEVCQPTPDRLETEIMLARTTSPDFTMVVPGDVQHELTNALTERFSQPFLVDERELTIGATIAHDAIAFDDRELTKAITNVSAAVAQADGRQVEVVPFEIEHREELQRRATITDWLPHAIANDELTVHFQPIVNALTTKVEGYEALVRGQMFGEPLSPAEFIPVAEETGAIISIGEFVLQTACDALPRLKGRNPYVSVNLSPVELSNIDLIDVTEQILIDNQIDRRRIVFEVTEGATATEEGLAQLNRLRQLGVRIAIDDFGTGQSNLSYLKDLPAQILKLDRSLITPMTKDPDSAMLVSKAIELAHGLGMRVTAEGVETHEELLALRAVNCDLIQGWFTGRPGPIEDFLDLSIDVAHTVSRSRRSHL